MCQKNTHLTKSHFFIRFGVSEIFFLKVARRVFLFWATQACICNKRRMFLKFLERIFVRNYCDIFFFTTPALNVCGSVCLEDGTGVTEAINVYSILHAELSAILKSWVEQNDIRAQP